MAKQLKNTTPIKAKNPPITIPASDPLKVKRGHQPWMCGAGTHQDRRFRRQRTRRAQLLSAVSQ